MIKVKIENEDGDSIIIEGRSLEEVRMLAQKEILKRNWDRQHCFSQVIE